MAKAKAKTDPVPDLVGVTPPAAFELSPEEMAAVLAARNKTTSSGSVSIDVLTKALVDAIETTRPPTKKTPFNRKPGNPWRTKDGSPKPKLKREWYQHGGLMDSNTLYPEEIELLNKVKPGVYVRGLVNVYKNKDRSYNITWPVKTAAQRLRVLNEAGGTFVAILQRCIDEKNDPKQFKGPDDDDDE